MCRQRILLRSRRPFPISDRVQRILFDGSCLRTGSTKANVTFGAYNGVVNSAASAFTHVLAATVRLHANSLLRVFTLLFHGLRFGAHFRQDFTHFHAGLRFLGGGGVGVFLQYYQFLLLLVLYDDGAYFQSVIGVFLNVLRGGMRFYAAETEIPVNGYWRGVVVCVSQ